MANTSSDQSTPARRQTQRRAILVVSGTFLASVGASNGWTAGTVAGTAAVGSYPNRPIRLIVGFAPGGATDVVARLFAQKLQEHLGQPVVVENKAGAGSNLAAEQLVRSAPDGYTLMIATIANATNVSVYKNLTYDPVRDFAPIIQIMSAPSVLVVGPQVAVNTLQELIALAKRRPGELTFASSGAGGSPHLAGEMLKLRAGIDLIHVPYKGAAPAMADVIGGSVTMGFKTALSAIPQMQAGKVKPIAVAANQRLAQIPAVPTLAELGLPNFEVSSWNGLVAPAKTPPEIINKLNQTFQAILQQPEIRANFATQAAEPIGGSPEQFALYFRTEIERWAHVVRASGTKID